MIRVLIADDHPLARRGLKDILTSESDIKVEGEVENGLELLKRIRKEKWDVAIMDFSMPGISGLDLVKQVHTEKPKLPLMILTMHPEKRFAIRCFKAGASAYLTKGSHPDEIIDAIRKLADGGKYVSPSLSESLVRTLGEPDGKMPHELLSDREFQVLSLIASGMAVSEIAQKLSLSVNTVSTYRARILEKMNLHNNAQLTQYAIENGLTE